MSPGSREPACKAQTGAYGRAERTRRAARRPSPSAANGLRAAREAPTLGPQPASRTACQERADARAQAGSRLEHDVKSIGLTGSSRSLRPSQVASPDPKRSLVKCSSSEYCQKCAGPAAGILSPDSIATNGAPAPHGGRSWGIGFDCGAGVVVLSTSSRGNASVGCPLPTTCGGKPGRLLSACLRPVRGRPESSSTAPSSPKTMPSERSGPDDRTPRRRSGS
jgi:hypothetical protein